ncbi:MAG: hypothetical protein COT39_00760 [Parcubacteria group bacterium CG08_land_8_20_14_0_20_48_21]|nr:MAG: hypothetical protein AUK21_03600 [Parcubacteria group bacterium CG2_30_48_51]PIS33192.1 MAG: hypothetical protein COT39_00760 [Parcubacteria group bacterium CG08_land_8_20_14_0_20_48_21]PIW79435.1 MAG: hypothetical protein COZ99_01285 [Parcubacteria group bacterium CG_4_8_14_3_um_filter_48_16]PIY77696.1 MAG: hypothetical protein COY83_04110 [Parcubacteria group bacterium CG_4_10_14_0_8_um_filter_48_154]PIZ77472.1 MAG: hypothetical protein COY03_02970 [bacterium CG_4_10_14_0_2_um_filter_
MQHDERQPAVQLIYDLLKIPLTIGGSALFFWIFARPQLVAYVFGLGFGIIVCMLFFTATAYLEQGWKHRRMWQVHEGLEQPYQNCKNDVSGYFFAIVVLVTPLFFGTEVVLSDYLQAGSAFAVFLLIRASFTSSFIWQTYRAQALTALMILAVPLLAGETLSLSDLCQAAASLPPLFMVQRCFVRKGFTGVRATPRIIVACARNEIGILLAASTALLPIFFKEPEALSLHLIQGMVALGAFYIIAYGYAYVAFCRGFAGIAVAAASIFLTPFVFGWLPSLVTLLQAAVVAVVLIGLQRCLSYGAPNEET